MVARLVIAKEMDVLNAKRPFERYYRGDSSSKESKAIVELSTKYQLFSELTNYILVDEVAEDKKPFALPEMHRVENMMVEKANISYSAREVCCSQVMENRSVSFDYSEDILDVPTFLKKRNRMSSSNDDSSIIFYDIPEEDTAQVDMSGIQAIWDQVEQNDHKRYLALLNDWFDQYKRLPRKKEELFQAGFDDEIVALFESRNFREQIKVFALKLYQSVGYGYVSDAFEKYLEKMLDKYRPGLFDKMLKRAQMLF